MYPNINHFTFNSIFTRINSLKINFCHRRTKRSRNLYNDAFKDLDPLHSIFLYFIYILSISKSTLSVLFLFFPLPKNPKTFSLCFKRCQLNNNKRLNSSIKSYLNKHWNIKKKINYNKICINNNFQRSCLSNQKKLLNKLKIHTISLINFQPIVVVFL